jgi:TonB-linked SusC/RagA family outer membrane protein
MKRRLTYLLLFAILGIGIASAQTRNVSGTVISSEDNLPVIGAAVVITGNTTAGTITDVDGNFTLSVPSSATQLTISYVGMTPQTVAIPRSGSIRVLLVPNAQALGEVVVTAMGITRERKSLGYAIAEVGSEELTSAGQMNITSALTGKMAGVTVNTFGGTVGASSRISVRGNSSLGNNQQPLIVVDGVPISNDTQRSGDNYYNGVDYGSGLNDINPEDIESMTVLKGGSAALYGMRAGNGVILITTKSGAKSNGVEIQYDGNFTIDQVANMPRLQNLYGQGASGTEYMWKQSNPDMSYADYAAAHSFSFVDGKGGGVNDGYDESWGPRLDIGLNLPQFDSPIVNGVRQATPWVSSPDNVKSFFQTGISQNHSISVLSRSDKASVRASLSYRDQVGTVPNTDQQRYGGQVNANVKLNKYISFDLNANYTRTESDNLLWQGYGGSNPINGLFLWSGRQINMQAMKDNWDQRDASGAYTMYNWNYNYHLNPYWNVYENTNGYQRDRFFNKTSLYYQPFEFLKFEGRLGFDYYNLARNEHHYMDYGDYPYGGFRQYNAKNTELNLDFIATFNKRFGDFDVTALAGANYRDAIFDSQQLTAAQLTIPGVYTPGNIRGTGTSEWSYSHIRSNSVFANASVGWKSQLYLDGSVRNDWSSTINDPIFYPSISASWIPTATFEGLQSDVLSYLKLRGGIAQVGNATSAYRTVRTFSANANTFNGVSQMGYSTQYPDANLKPENIATREVGLEAHFWKERIRLDVAYYDKVATNQILSVSTSDAIGFNSMLINAGRIRSKGVEVMLSGDVLKNSNGLNWTTTFTFSKDNSMIEELYGDQVTTYGIGWTWGIDTYAQTGKPWGIIIGSTYSRLGGDYNEDGKADDGYSGPMEGAIKVDANGYMQSVATQDIGHITPDFIGGWRNELHYKNLSMSFFFDLRIGGDIWSQSMMHSYVAGTAKITADNNVREDGVQLGRNFMTDQKFVQQDASGNWVEYTGTMDAQRFFEGTSIDEFNVFDGSYLKLREFSLTYSVPAAWLAKTLFIKRCNVSLIGSNLALLWVHKSNTMRLDPETGGVSSDSRGLGFEQASVPTSRSFGLKLGITF